MFKEKVCSSSIFYYTAAVTLWSGWLSFLVCFLPFLSRASVSRSVHRQPWEFTQLAVLWLTATMLLYKKLSNVYIKPNRLASAIENNSEALCSMRFHFKHMNSSSSLGSLRIDFDFFYIPIFTIPKELLQKKNKNKGDNFQLSEICNSWTNKHWKGIKD